MEPTTPGGPRPPVHEAGLDMAELDLHGGPGFWDEARRIAGASGLGPLVEQTLRRGSPPRLWVVMDEPQVTGTRVAAALAIARELSRQGQSVLVLDGDDRHPDLTRWSGRFEQEGWIDILRYGASLAASSIPLPWEGRGGRLVGIGSYAPVSAAADEVERLLRRLRTMAEDIVVCLPLAPESAPWLAAADLRLLCWDRHRRSAERNEELARELAGDGPYPEIVAFGPAVAGLAEAAAPGGGVDEAIRRAADPLGWQRQPAAPAPQPAAPPSAPLPAAEEVEALLAGLAEIRASGSEAPTAPGEPDLDEDEELPEAEIPETGAPPADGEAAPAEGLAGDEEVSEDQGELEEEEFLDDEEFPEDEEFSEDEEFPDEELSEQPAGSPATGDADLAPGTEPSAEDAWPEAIQFPVPPPRSRGSARPFWIAAAVLAVAAVALGGWYFMVNRPRDPGVIAAGAGVSVREALPPGGAPAEQSSSPDAGLRPTSPAEQGALAAGVDTTAGGAPAAPDTAALAVAPPPPADPAPAAAPGLDHEPAAGRGWALWVSSLADSLDAGAEVARLRGLGLRAKWRPVELPERGLWYRVYVGSFASRAEAEQAVPEAQRRLRHDFAMPARF